MAAARRLEFDLLRHLRAEARSDSRFEPEHLELEFGYGNGHEPVEIAAGLRVRGRIDRVDTHDGLALVHRLQERQARRPLQGRELGEGESLPGGALHARRRAAARAARRGRRVRGSRRRRPAPARHGRGRGRRARLGLVRRRPARAGRLPRDARLGARADPRRPTPRCAPGASAPRPSAATGRAAASTRRSAGARDDRADARAGARGRAPRRARCSCAPARAPARRRCSSSASCARWSTTAPPSSRCSPSPSPRRPPRR